MLSVSDSLQPHGLQLFRTKLLFGQRETMPRERRDRTPLAGPGALDSKATLPTAPGRRSFKGARAGRTQNATPCGRPVPRVRRARQLGLRQPERQTGLRSPGLKSLVPRSLKVTASSWLRLVRSPPPCGGGGTTQVLLPVRAESGKFQKHEESHGLQQWFCY